MFFSRFRTHAASRQASTAEPVTTPATSDTQVRIPAALNEMQPHSNFTSLGRTAPCLKITLIEYNGNGMTLIAQNYIHKSNLMGEIIGGRTIYV